MAPGPKATDVRRPHTQPLAIALCAGVLVLGVSACQRERAQMDTQSAATAPAETPPPTTPADTTGSETADTLETPNTTQGTDVTAEAPMEESNPTGTTANPPPPVTEQTDQSDLNRDTMKAEPPEDRTDTDEGQAPQKY